jgi:signal transduction histidine kinase
MMCGNESKSFKHELRTPVNHIIGYSALLQDTAEEESNTPLAKEAADMHSLGTELNRVIERMLVCSDHGLQVEDIQGIKDAVAPLFSRIGMSLASCFDCLQDEGAVADLRRIGSAVDRLQSILDNAVASECSIEKRY